MGWLNINGNWIGRNSGVSWSTYWKTHLFDEADLNFRTKSRSGLSLVDDFGSNASILLPCVASRTISSGNKDPCATSSISIVANTIWVVKMRGKAGLYGNPCSTNGALGIREAYFGGTKYSFLWGDKKTAVDNITNVAWDNVNIKVFIIYAGKFWILPGDTDMSDTSLTNIINNTTPTKTVTGTLTPDNSKLYYVRIPSLATTYEADWYKSFIGTVTDGVITWQAKHIFNNKYYVYDLLGNDHIPFVTNLNYPAILYSAEGDRSTLDIGHTRCIKSGEKPFSLPYINGEPDLVAPLFSGFVRITDNPAIATKHNYADSLIEFQGDLWDRSNTDIYEDLARAATTYYDVLNPKRWHPSELNRLQMNDWLKSDYRGMWFPKILPNSVDEEECLSIDEIFSYSTNKIGTDFNKVLLYCNDYDLIVI